MKRVIKGNSSVQMILWEKWRNGGFSRREKEVNAEERERGKITGMSSVKVIKNHTTHYLRKTL